MRARSSAIPPTERPPPGERLPSGHAFLARPEDVQLTVGGTSRIEVRSPGAGTLDLEADAIWLRLRESP